MKALGPFPFSQISNSLGHSKNFYTVITMVSILTLEFGGKNGDRENSLRQSMTQQKSAQVSGDGGSESWTPLLCWLCDLIQFSLPPWAPKCLRNGMLSRLPEGMGWTRRLPKVPASGKTVIYQKSQSCKRLGTQFGWSGFSFWKYGSYKSSFFSNIIFGTLYVSEAISVIFFTSPSNFVQKAQPWGQFIDITWKVDM